MNHQNPDTSGQGYSDNRLPTPTGEIRAGAQTPATFSSTETGGQRPNVPAQTAEKSPAVPSLETQAPSVETPGQINQELDPHQSTTAQPVPPLVPSSSTTTPQMPGTNSITPRGYLDTESNPTTSAKLPQSTTPALLAEILPKDPNGQSAFQTVEALRKLKKSHQQSSSNHLS